MLEVFRGKRPDLTPAQVVGVLVGGVPIVSNLLHVFGVFDLSHEQSQALQDTLTWGGVFAGLLFGSDAVLRSARNHADAKVEAAALAPAPSLAQLGGGEPPVGPIALPTEGDEPRIVHVGDGDGLPTDEEEFAGVGPDDDPGPESRIEPDGEGAP